MSTHLLNKGTLILDLVWHIKVIQTVSPAQLLDNVGPQEIEADVEDGSETFLIPDIHEVAQQFFRNLDGVGGGGGNDGILEQLVLFRQRNRIIPFAVLLVQVSSQPPEFEQSVLLELLGEGDIVEVIEAVDRIPKGVVIFFLDQKSVVCIVDGFDVQLCSCVNRGSSRLGQKPLTCCTAIRYDRMSGMWSI